jgi:hypothetical protein
LTSEARAQQSTTSPSFASFGWELANLNNNGADVFFEVTTNLVLSAADFDVAFMLTSPPSEPGFAEILCRAAISPGAPPTFYKDDPGASFVSPASPNFGKVKVHNPHGLNIGNDGYLLQNVFFSVILKTWVTADGTASSTSRHVRLAQSLALNAGDYLVFNMSHGGVSGDCEMQVTIEYVLT